MADITTDGVVGIDLHTPVYEPDAVWRMWSIHDIYLGTVGYRKHVPKIKDFVVDPDDGRLWIVEHIDPVTLVPTLRPKRFAGDREVIEVDDLLFGLSDNGDTYRAYLDASVFPHVMALDKRFKIPGNASTYIKVFHGGVVNENSKVISKVYDNSGQMISENVPLELVIIDTHHNYSLKHPSVFNCVEYLKDGDLVTAVVYTDQGHVIYKKTFMVENTSFIPSLNMSRRYVSHISLKSPFNSQTIEKRIEFPLNTPVNALNFIGVAHYTDGRTLELPVDGTRFELQGIDQYLSSIPGQKTNVVLRYTLGPEELTTSGVTYNNKFISEPYELVTTDQISSYSVKLFGYPFWVNESVGYKMRWWLYNLDRNVYYEVSDKVRFDENTGPYDPKGYGVAQRKSVSINLRDVSPMFKSFIHVQFVEIVLNGPPNQTITPWTVSLEYNQVRPVYGRELTGLIGNGKLNISFGIATYTEWLKEIYYNSFPLTNPTLELNAPKPTHFILNYKGKDYTYQMTKWNIPITLIENADPYETVTIRFVKETPTGTLHLGISAILIK